MHPYVRLPNVEERTIRTDMTESDQPALIVQAFPIPVALVFYPYANEFNDPIADPALARLTDVENKFSYKAVTSADMTRWEEPVIDSITQWVLRTARQFVETVLGRSLEDAFSDSARLDQNVPFDASGQEMEESISICAGRSWASIYRKGDRHEAHFHPNTAMAAIYYVEGPGQCELDLLDPRPNIEYFNLGISFAGESRRLRLRCTPGELILFPGWLKHAVPEFTEDSTRISISWNLGYAGSAD